MCLLRCVVLEKNKINEALNKIFASENGEVVQIAYISRSNEKLPYLYVTRIAVSTKQGGHDVLCLHMRETLHIQRAW
jgi:hypothetical protein